MNARDSRRAPFAARPHDPEAWVRAPAATETGPAKADLYTARLTIDVTPELRGRIKVAAFRRGQTVADMLRSMLQEAFPGRRERVSMSRSLTRATILFLEGKVNDRVRFGLAAGERILDRRCRIAMFAPGSLFGYVQWRANRFGTELWRLWVLRAGRAGGAR